MPKTLEENFRDWEADLFGLGYGTGEPHTLRALKRFLELCPDVGGTYDYRDLERELTPAVAWLLINALGRTILDYGTSPRHGWLSPQGKALKAFVADKSVEQLVDICLDHDENYIACMHDACNCGPTGYEAGRKCVNPFWR